jgi:hypothetical protein
MGLGLGQLVFASAQGGVDKEAGQSHAGSLKIGSELLLWLLTMCGEGINCGEGIYLW